MTSLPGVHTATTQPTALRAQLPEGPTHQLRELKVVSPIRGRTADGRFTASGRTGTAQPPTSLPLGTTQ